METAIRLIIAAIVGSVLGFERELKNSPAGMRTHALVTLGSATFTLASLSFSQDPARIAAQVAVGIGFLGGGVIFKSGNTILGLTTAANLWIASAIGLMIGLGQYVIGLTATALAILTLILGSYFEKKALGKKKKY